MKFIKTEKKWLVLMLREDMLGFYPDSGWSHEEETKKFFIEKYKKAQSYNVNYRNLDDIIIGSYDTLTEARSESQSNLNRMFFIAGQKTKDQHIGLVGSVSIVKNDVDSIISISKRF